MPELPEVETVRRGLAPRLQQRAIISAIARRADLRWPLPSDFSKRLRGRRIEALRRRAKYLLFDLDDGATLIVHLGMSGRLIVAENDAANDGAANDGAANDGAAANGAAANDGAADVGAADVGAKPGGRRSVHDHVILTLDDGGRVTFNDPRRFGAMDIAATADLAGHRLLAHLGPEPLDSGFDGATLAGALAGRTAAIKTALLDQRIVAGLGNIYVCEALFRARIGPLRTAGSCVGARAARLVDAIRVVLTEAIAAGGSSLRDYVQASGEAGYFQHDFAVYGRAGAPCPRCGRPIRRIVQSARATFFCAACQR